jgi:glycine cleavage system transcriptional repressor
MAEQYLVITAVGPDRPGLVDSISEFVYRHGGNVEASRMAVLGDQFAILMMVSGSPEATAAIRDDLDALESSARLRCSVAPAGAPTTDTATLPYDLTVASMDHPGIVRAISHHLAERGVNITEMNTHVENAPHTGAELFILTARLEAPAEINLGRFRAELSALAENLNVDVRLSVAGK